MYEPPEVPRAKIESIFRAVLAVSDQDAADALFVDLVVAFDKHQATANNGTAFAAIAQFLARAFNLVPEEDREPWMIALLAAQHEIRDTARSHPRTLQ